MKNIEKIRLYLLYNLIFCLWLWSCSNDKAAGQEIVLGWENKQVKKILVPVTSTGEVDRDTLLANMRVRLAKAGAPDIAGTYSLHQEFVVFEPVIAFTGGLKYEVYYRDRQLSQFEIPAPSKDSAPTITAIYPTEDSLPENLLKIYICFSKPMQEGVSAEKVELIKGGTDTLSNVFLDLQPELWNPDRTILTLWLNPGRIKRDLAPNREMGPPLLPNTSYQILVKPGWQDELGNPDAAGYRKNFMTVSRDMLSPERHKWQVEAPKAGTLQPVILRMGESLDYLLLRDAVKVIDYYYHDIPGRIEVTDNEREWRFIPFAKWKQGEYWVAIERRLEDPAGNNLERLFDEDLANPAKEHARRSAETDVTTIYHMLFKTR